MIYAKFDWNCPSGSGEEDFKNLSMYFSYFLIISPWKRAGSFIWTNLNPLHPRMLCAKFGWNWPWNWFWRWDENVKSLRQQNDDDDNDNDNDDAGQRTNFDQESSLEPSAHLNLKVVWSAVYGVRCRIESDVLYWYTQVEEY